MEEIWKDVVGYEGYYKVSNLGRVKSLDRIVWNGYANHVKKGRVIKTQINGNGYEKTELQVEKKRTNHRIHRLVAEAFIPNPENKYAVNHIDGIKTNNHVSNLEWCNKSENMKHAYETGLIERSGNRTKSLLKLSDEQVIEIRTRFTPFVLTSKMLAKEYGVSYNTIEGLLFGKNKRPHLPTRQEILSKK